MSPDLHPLLCTPTALLYALGLQAVATGIHLFACDQDAEQSLWVPRKPQTGAQCARVGVREPQA